MPDAHAAGSRRRRRWRRRLLVAAGVLLAVLLLGPLVVPIPPPPGTVPPEQLAGPGSRFVDVGDVRVHVEVRGRGDATPLVLLHGFGASTFSWRDVLTPLAEDRRVAAFDRPAFGLTSRPPRAAWHERNPYSPGTAADLVVEVMDALGFNDAVLVGHSQGADVAVRAALAHPGRVAGLVLVAPALGGGGRLPRWLRPLTASPQGRRIGPLLVRRIAVDGVDVLHDAWYDPARIDADILEGYRLPLRADGWDVALWEFTLARAGAEELKPHLGEVTVPALVLTGTQDAIVPPAASRRAADALPTATYIEVPACGHVPHEECPEAFRACVELFLRARVDRR